MFSKNRLIATLFCAGLCLSQNSFAQIAAGTRMLGGELYSSNQLSQYDQGLYHQNILDNSHSINLGKRFFYKENKYYSVSIASYLQNRINKTIQDTVITVNKNQNIASGIGLGMGNWYATGLAKNRLYLTLHHGFSTQYLRYTDKNRSSNVTHTSNGLRLALSSGLGIQYQLLPKWYIGTNLAGINYTFNYYRNQNTGILLPEYSHNFSLNIIGKNSLSNANLYITYVLK